MSIEHSNAMPEIRPAVMAALHKHATNAAAYIFLRRLNRRQEANYYNERCAHALNELRALGVQDEEGRFVLTPAEDRAITAFYTDELQRLKAQEAAA